MPPARLIAAAFLTGAAVMIVELMAVRAMAPWFGQSQLVWTNVIGVVLGALAAGQWLGGRAAEAPGAAAARPLIVAGALALALPDLLAWLGPRVLPDELPLREAHPFVVWGSLLAAVVGLGPPLLAAGAVTPALVRLSREAERAPGRVAGRLLGAGTLGSLLGTFAATHLLLGALGSHGAVRVGGLLLLAAGGLLLGRVRDVGGAPVVLLVPLLGLAVPREQPPGTWLADVETPYQRARVEELEDGTRALRLNEGLDSFHSLHKPGRLLTGAYYDAFLGPVLAAPRSPDGRLDVLVVGLAAGTMAHQALAVRPDARVRGLEIDAAVVELGRRWFDLPEAVDVLAGVDARVAVEHDDRRYGAVLVDAYSEQIYLPAHLCTESFFLTLRERLLPGGVVALNVGGLSREDPVVAAVAGTFARVLPGATMGRVPSTRNMLVMGWKGEAPPPEAWRAALDAAGLDDALAWLVEGRGVEPVPPAPGPVLRDGRSPVEALAHASWRGRSVDLDPVGRPPADGDTETALALARRRLAATDWSGTVALARPLASHPEAAVAADAAFLLGNVAFERGRWEEAVRHYQAVIDAAPRLGAEAPLVTTAAGNRELARSMGERARRLRSRAARLRLVTAGALGAVVVGLLLVRRLGPA